MTKKENQAIKDSIIRVIRNFFEHKEEENYESVRLGSFWSNNYIEYENNDDRNKKPSFEKFLNNAISKRHNK